MHPRLSVHTIGFGLRPLREVVHELAELGLHRIGTTMLQLVCGGVDANVAAVRAAGTQVVDVAEPTAFLLEQPASWPGRRDELRRSLDAVAALGAEQLYLTTGPAASLTWDQAALRFVEAVAPVAEHARQLGLTLALENTTTMRADLGFVHRLRDVTDLAQLAGLSVCADLFVSWTDRDLEQAIRDGVERFSLVQVSDFALGTLSTPDRAVPGDGNIPLRRHLDWLSQSGYAGPVELELLGPRIDREGAGAAALRAAGIVSQWLPHPGSTG